MFVVLVMICVALVMMISVCGVGYDDQCLWCWL